MMKLDDEMNYNVDLIMLSYHLLIFTIPIHVKNQMMNHEHDILE